MSRIGKKPIAIPKGVTVKVEGNTVLVQGPKGKAGYSAADRNQGRAEGRAHPRDSRKRFAVGRAWTGARTGQQRGRGRDQGLDARTGNRRHRLSRRDEGQGSLSCSTWDIRIRSSIRCRPASMPRSIRSRRRITLTGIDRQKVGQVAAEMRSLRPPDPYKNKGVRYVGERLKKKVGKTGAK